MKLDIHKLDLPWCDVLAGHVERRVRRDLARLGDRVGSVFVLLVGGPSPRGEHPARRCRLAVRLTSGHQVLADALDACAFRAVDDAVGRLATMVGERARREQARRRVAVAGPSHDTDA